MFNKADILIDILKEDKDLYNQENVSLEEKIKIVKVMVNGVELQPENNEYNYEIKENGTYIVEVVDENNNTYRKEARHGVAIGGGRAHLLAACRADAA